MAADVPPTDGKKKVSRGLQQIQATLEEAESGKRREQFKQRMELARQGVMAFREKRLGDAAKAFYTYLRILEDWKGVPENGLTPGLFDRQKELSEILLLNGIYWDLAIMYDRTTSEDKTREFLRYLEKYVLFSKGFPHQHVAAETLRRHVLKGRPTHRRAFTNAYQAMTDSKCFVATSLIDQTDENTVERLREFRDSYLMKVRLGRVFVRGYYRAGPYLVKALDRAPEGVRKVLGKALDLLSEALFRFVSDGK